MESFPDDLKRIISAFAGPAPGARHVAARARTLDEFVKYRLATSPDHSYERTTIQDGIANTCAHVKLVHALRIVSKQWRDIITYGSARQLTLKADSCVEGQLPLVVLDLRWTAIETLPASLRTTATLRILELVDTRLSADVDDAIRVKRGRVRVRRRGYDSRAFAANPRQGGTPGDADDIRRRDTILRPLSLAIPDLRIHMHSDEDGNDFERAASMHWWHARCGHDWWDVVFFAPPPED